MKCIKRALKWQVKNAYLSKTLEILVIKWWIRIRMTHIHIRIKLAKTHTFIMCIDKIKVNISNLGKLDFMKTNLKKHWNK